ncbi:hypothetical protein [Streptomyces sp. S1D4-14]|uniref:hypothetical protein n=1 Tax=Streptomyces sp. S1D4-14 TaxID=2594461 RepID=UPI001164ED7B|nr:hypothetical protein [Streptomyces sp. S1D4-14]QDN64412.1 hypothetical protein FNV66_00845 [Streptomyces sp. S1D4-14]
MSWQQVAEQMVSEYPEYLDGEGSVSAAFACVDVTRALKEANKELAMGLEEYREAARMRLDGLRRQVFAVLARPHYVLHQGQFVIDEDGNKVRDDGPVLAAVDRLLRIEERQAKIDGTDASEKLTIALDRRVDEETTVVVESILAGANAVDLEPAQRQRMLEAAGAHLRTLEGEVVSETEE